MPIAFPVHRRGNVFDDFPRKYQYPLAVPVPPNLGRVSEPVTRFTLNPGVPGRGVLKAPNVRRLGTQFASVQASAVVSPQAMVVLSGLATRVHNARVWDRVQAILSTSLVGVSRDAAGAPLGNCRVMVFRTDNNAFVAETVSDGSGNWQVLVTPFTFYLVEYLAGAPDRFGTSPNTLIGIPFGG